MVYDDGDTTPLSIVVENIVKNISSKVPMVRTQTIGTSEEAIGLPDGTVAYAIFQNLDPTNFINLRVSTGGAIFARLDPDTKSDGKGGVAMLRLGSGATAPFAIADTAECKLRYIIVPA